MATVQTTSALIADLANFAIGGHLIQNQSRKTHCFEWSKVHNRANGKGKTLHPGLATPDPTHIHIFFLLACSVFNIDNVMWHLEESLTGDQKVFVQSVLAACHFSCNFLFVHWLNVKKKINFLAYEPRIHVHIPQTT